MSSVVPPPQPHDDEQTPIDGFARLVERVTRLEHTIGYGNQDGMRGEQLSITKAINIQTVLLQGLQEQITKLSAKLDAHAHTERERNKLDIQLHEAEREADATAANKRHEALAGKIDAARSTLAVVLASQMTLVAMLAVLLLRGCP